MSSHHTTSALPAVKLESFEGPFDLLVELARKKKLDLTDVSLKQITQDFLNYMDQHEVTPSVQGDFLVVASTLLYLKIRHLLPDLQPDEEEEVEELTGRVQTYRLYRDKAAHIRTHWDSRRLYPARFWGEGVYRTRPQGLPSCTPSDLAAAMNALAEGLPKPPQPRAHLARRGRSLDEARAVFAQRLAQAKKIVFQHAMSGSDAQDKAVSFLAVLEMAKHEEVQLHQTEVFGDITVEHTAS